MSPSFRPVPVVMFLMLGLVLVAVPARASEYTHDASDAISYVDENGVIRTAPGAGNNMKAIQMNQDIWWNTWLLPTIILSATAAAWLVVYVDNRPKRRHTARRKRRHRS